MAYNDLGFVSDSSLRRWTYQAIECYLNRLNCGACNLPIDIKEKCRMKACVLELVKIFGKPETKLRNYDEFETEIDTPAD